VTNGGAMVEAVRSDLKLEQSVFLGSVSSSGLYGSDVQNLEWKGISVTDTAFADYGQRPELFSKTGYGAPYSWVGVGNAAATDAASPRREAVFENVFFDEGALAAVASLPGRYQPPSASIDLLYVSNLHMNDSNLGTSSLYLSGLSGALVENSSHGWSHNAGPAIYVVGAGEAILDRVRCSASVTTLAADAATSRLWVIDSGCPVLDSHAQVTEVVTPATPEDDPVQYVRGRFEAALGRGPDAAAHFYWSEKLLRCGADAACVADARDALDAYLSGSPAPTFALAGIITDDEGTPLAGVTVALAGSQAARAVTDQSGGYRFASLPSSGNYSVTASKPHYTFDPPTLSFTTPPADLRGDFAAKINRHAIFGHVTGAGGSSASGVNVTLDGPLSEGATTDAGGNYSFTGLPEGGSYTVTPSQSSFVFSPATRTVDDLEADQNADFSLVTHSISGHVTRADGTGVAGAVVSLSGSQSATATTDASGSYAFPNAPANGDYTLSVARVNYTFAQPSLTFKALSSNQTANFTGSLLNFQIAGHVTSGGAGLGGVTLSLSGSQSGTVTTDAGGAYSFTIPAEGSYVLTPSKTHYTFAPQSLSFSNVVANQTADFAATINRHTINGHVTDAGIAIAGVSVALSGAQSATATTDASGAYSFANLPEGGSYTITPSFNGFTFSPASRTVADLEADQASDFALVTHSISGHVKKADGTGVAGAVVSLSGSRSATATTDASGGYSFLSVPANGNYTLSVSRVNYTFAPTQQTFAGLASDKTADFTGTPGGFIIAGHVTSGGAALAGITLSLSGSQSATATTDSTGAYSFSVLAEGSYVLTPSKTHYTFAPQSLSFSNVVANQTADFAATINRHTINGRATDANNYPLPNVSVALSGSQSATAMTDASGNFAFQNLPDGSNYTVTPSQAALVFSPASLTFNDLSADQFAGFIGSPAPIPTPTPTPTPTPSPTPTPTQTPTPTPSPTPTPQSIVAFSSASYTAAEGGPDLYVTLTRSGDASSAARVVYSAASGTARRGSDFVAGTGEVSFAPGETQKSFPLFITDDSFVEGDEQFTVSLASETAGVAAGGPATVTIKDNDAAPSPVNPVDDTQFFVRQHYRDFLGREPDAAGLQFWANNIDSCGADSRCREAKRVDTSAAFFLSIEFQNTGFFVYRVYQSALGRVPARAEEFMLDSRIVGDGLVVGEDGWQQKLDGNKAAYVAEFVSRPEFAERYPSALTPSQFVAALDAGTGGSLSASEVGAAQAEFGGSSDTSDLAARARVVREVAENASFSQKVSSPAFVLMQYYGYLRRAPDEAPDKDMSGYDFWLAKLNQFGGDFHAAEMVKAFIESAEYRQRFGP